MTNVPEKTYTMIYLHTHGTVPAILLTVVYVNVFRTLSRRTREVQREGYNSVASKALERDQSNCYNSWVILHHINASVHISPSIALLRIMQEIVNFPHD